MPGPVVEEVKIEEQLMEAIKEQMKLQFLSLATTGNIASEAKRPENPKVMGAYCNEDLNLPVYSAGAPTNELRFSKHVYDNVHGNICLDPLCLKFIDTEQFQRLRELKQLDHRT